MRGQGAKISKKLILDDVCGVQKNSFKNQRIFQNHYRTHGEQKFQCKECPAIWITIHVGIWWQLWKTAKRQIE